MTDTQTALRLDTPGKPTTRLTGGYYRPPITPKGISTCDSVTYGQNKATGLPGWNLHFTAKPGAGAVTVWFARDETNLTIFCDDHNIKLPTVGKLTVNWRLTWHKAGYANVIDAIELLPLEDVPVNTAPATKPSEMDEYLPRDGKGEPKPIHWIDNDKARGAFWSAVTPWITWAGYDGKAADFAHDKIGKMHDWTDGYEAAVERLVKEAILYRWQKAGRELGKGDFGAATGYSTLKDAQAKGGLSDVDVRNLIDAHLAKPAPQPQASVAPPAGATDAGAISLPEPQENATVTISDGKTTPSQSGMSEAGFSMNFFWCDADGAETQFTMREATWQAGLENVEKFKAGLRKLGYMPKAEYARKNGAPVGTSAPAAPPPAESNAGAVKAVMIKVASSFNGGKPQLEFECDGFEHPLRYTKESPGLLAQILKDVRKLDGTPFTAADMETGKKYVGNWIIDWQKSEKDGKTYHNVMRVRAA